MPDPVAVEKGLLGSSLTYVDPDKALVAVIDHINREWVNGRAMAAQFHLDLDPHIAFFAGRNRLHEIPFFPFFFAAPIQTDGDPLAAYLELFGQSHAMSHDDDTAWTFRFRLVSSRVSLAYLASRLEEGGVYASPPLPDAEISALVSAVAVAAFDGRYRSALSYHSVYPWCDWFDGEMRDASWFWLDLETGLATILLVTDAP